MFDDINIDEDTKKEAEDLKKRLMEERRAQIKREQEERRKQMEEYKQKMLQEGKADDPEFKKKMVQKGLENLGLEGKDGEEGLTEEEKMLKKRRDLFNNIKKGLNEES